MTSELRRTSMRESKRKSESQELQTIARGITKADRALEETRASSAATRKLVSGSSLMGLRGQQDVVKALLEYEDLIQQAGKQLRKARAAIRREIQGQ